ncbi:MAG: tRNA (adenosine(37)-N6)-threonylcarbamoyltransferase complex ATPase subunit type 1 TsaE [Sphingobacteriia bacterium]|nr:tRNA (adenosine(37)-N6)-threonylcarbamoyltransferase complex ATPase subunit type 1 TsaE [Sphingobacteriia bacterium]
MIAHSLLISSETQLEKIALEIAEKLQQGDTITLRGDLGAGKTTFTRFLINSLFNKSIEVQSPTFTLVHEYVSPKGKIWHYDLYRLKDKREIRELLLLDFLEKDICIIEWPEIIEEYLPENRLDIYLDYMEDNLESRIVKFVTHGSWLERIKDVSK